MVDKPETSDSAIKTAEVVTQFEIRECKICFKRFEESELKSGQVINPCNCQGIYAFAHKACINARLELNGHQSCDVCRFAFVMKTKSKSLIDWSLTFPNKEELVELIIRSVNLANISVITLIALIYSQIQIKRVWILSLIFFKVIRIVVLGKLWIQLIRKSYHDFKDWKTKNFHIFVEQNPNYRKKIGAQRPKSPTRLSGAFNKSKESLAKKND